MKKTATALTLIAIAATPAAHADTADQQYLNTVHSNGVGGQDDTLIAYAHEWCTSMGFLPSGPALIGQGVFGAQQTFIVRTAASRAYCPDKIAAPITAPIITSQW